MCGIIGILGQKAVTPLLVDGLKRLEYRGYDSAGIATLRNGQIDRRRAEGKIVNLEAVIEREPLEGTVGIGHTRWATHGRPTEVNAHPHANSEVAVVHNGIIENFRALRKELEAAGHSFETETDTEVIVHLITDYLRSQKSPEEAVAATLKRLHGAFAVAIVFAGRHDLMIGARRGSPLALGYGNGELYLGSDSLALAPLTDQICFLEEGDWVVLKGGEARIFDQDDSPVERPVTRTVMSGAMIGKGSYRHFMQKEIFEQPVVIGDTLQSYVDPLSRRVTLPELPFDFARIPRLTASACGTAFYAGMVGRYWFEQVARLPMDIDIASEFRYREAPLPENGAALFISQSGETIDTLSALRYTRTQKQHILSIVNQQESAIARESDAVMKTLAGPEIGVASTKAFTTQLVVLACLALAAGRARGCLSAEAEAELTSALIEVPAQASYFLEREAQLIDIANEMAEASDILYMGRGSMYPLALEGALKFKEISYLHAEGYAAGELKHGAMALIDEHVPIVVCASSGPLFDKTAGNIQEVIARGGRVVLISDEQGIDAIGEGVTHAVQVPEVSPFVAPILYALPLQLLAYHTAVIKGTDVDQPRNLAKSVTVE
ncbi:glutamine--fructose-6-phosphate transaminase (isomerizing) [Fodinicurvata sediminis]|uniref:glutamine--fructose-6-phosphate transaminase (isomerizing) n=1 Tax=Fodinicurvata sediminis TaxID=1121832 RepID=UPI0003B3E007|nr:glutamine--fructose-6-phosphate transaminase (isomerizing) [Fodinicurvata sediminis]